MTKILCLFIPFLTIVIYADRNSLIFFFHPHRVRRSSSSSSNRKKFIYECQKQQFVTRPPSTRTNNEFFARLRQSHTQEEKGVSILIASGQFLQDVDLLFITIEHRQNGQQQTTCSRTCRTIILKMKITGT